MANNNNGEEYGDEEDYKKSEDEEDIYKEEDVEEELEQDEIKAAEAGFMEGYDREMEELKEDLPNGETAEKKEIRKDIRRKIKA